VLAEFSTVSLVFAYQDLPDYTAADSYLERYRAMGPALVSVPAWDPHLALKNWQAEIAGTRLLTVNFQHRNSTTAMLKNRGYE
jgi:hypothetical protein